MCWDARPFPDRDANLVSSGVGILVPPYSPMVHLNITSQHLVKKHECWPFSTEGTAAHAYTPVEGMVSRWMADANCFDRRFHLSGTEHCRWLRARWGTSWCSNDLRALRSVGCPAPPSSCLRDPSSLILSRSTVTPPGRWNWKKVLCYEEKKEHLTGLCKNSDAWTRATWLKSPFWF